MGTETTSVAVHPEGVQPEVEAWSAVADTYAGRVHVEWDATAPVTPFGQLPFFIEYLLVRPLHHERPRETGMSQSEVWIQVQGAAEGALRFALLAHSKTHHSVREMRPGIAVVEPECDSCFLAGLWHDGFDVAGPIRAAQQHPG